MEMDNMHVLTSILQANFGQRRMFPLGHTGSECRLACTDKPHARSIRNSLQDGGRTSFVVNVRFNSDTRLWFQLGFHS
jgi:hypothetical protein